MAGEIRVIGPTGRTCYVHILNETGQRWNGAAFESFSASNYANYDVPVTEDGATGIFRGDFPSGITAGRYDVVLFIQAGGSPANGDRPAGAQALQWLGSSVATAGAVLGSLSGLSLRNYIVRSGWLRDDMDTELYDALTDTILEMEQLFDFDERKTEATSTDTITTLGDYKINVEANLGHLISVVIIDGSFSRPLIPTSKALFDLLYPNPTEDNDRGYPERFCFYGGQLLIGPAPDRVSYQYRMAFSERLVTAIDALTNPVPFSAKYREIIKDGTLGRLFKNVKAWDSSDRFTRDFGGGMARAVTLEKRNRKGVMNMPYQDC